MEIRQKNFKMKWIISDENFVLQSMYTCCSDGMSECFKIDHRLLHFYYLTFGIQENYSTFYSSNGINLLL